MLLPATAAAFTYVVDPTGSDVADGSDDAPWRTIQHAVSQLAPGDTLRIRAGQYVESVSVNHGGSSGNPIVLSAVPGAVLVSPNAWASLEAISIAPGVSDVSVIGLEAVGFDETIYLRHGVHDVRITGCDLHGNHAGIVLDGAFNVTVDACAVHDNSGVGVRLSGTTHDVLVRDTDSYRNGVVGTCSSKVDGFAAAASTRRITFVGTTASPVHRRRQPHGVAQHLLSVEYR